MLRSSASNRRPRTFSESSSRETTSSDPLVRAEAAEDLGYPGVRSASATTELTVRLTDANSRVRLCAASALLRIDWHIQSSLETLKQGLLSTDEGIRRAARAAARAGEAAAPLISQLVSLLTDQAPAARIEALVAISMMDGSGAPAVPSIIPLLDRLLKRIVRAIDRAADQREKLLLNWCLRQVSAP